MKNRSLAGLLLLFTVSLPAVPQQPAPTPQGERPNAQPQQPDTQDPDDTDVVRIRTNLVQIDAVVTKDGKQVTDLTPEDFEIFEDGKKQVITNFSYVSNVPSSSPDAVVKPVIRGLPVVPPAIRPDDPRRTIALVVDDLGISMESVGPLKLQLRKFIDEQMQPNDLVAIIRTGGEVGALQQFTTDKRLLHRSVERVRRHTCSRMGRTVFARVGSSGNTSICGGDALKLSARALSFIVQGLGELPGRKSMVVFSDSMPLDVRDLETVDGLTEGSIDKPVSADPLNPSTEVANQFNIGVALKKLAELAIRSSVVIYGVDTRGVQPTGVTAGDNFNAQRTVADLAGMEQSASAGRSHQMLDLRAGAEMVAKETGGFLIRNSNDFQLQRVMSDQEGYYLIGYRPTSETFNRRFHHIKARVKRSGLSLRTREGFFGVTDEAARRPVRTNRDRMNLALVSPFASADIDVQLTTLFGNTAVNGSQLHSLLYFQARDLTFTQEADGWHQAVFDLSGVIFGDNGTIAHQTSETRTLRLRSEAYEEVLRDGLVYRLDLPVPKPGSYQFRVAVRDASSSRMGTAGQFVDVPNLNNGRLVLSGITVSDFAEANKSQTALKAENAQQTADRPSMSGPARRRFRIPSNLFFGYVIHNAQLDKATQQPKLLASMRLLRDGKVIFEGQEKAVDLNGQSDLKRIMTGGGLQLGTEMAAGEYVLQITVTDMLASEKYKTTTQWIDFEIVK